MAQTGRSLVLVSGLAFGVACSGVLTGSSDGGPTHNPPMPKMEKRSPPTDALTRGPIVGSLDTLVNPSLRDGRVVFASHDGGCHVYEPLDVPPPGGQHGASEPVHCPHIMLDPVWAHCAGDSTMYIDNAGELCNCRVSGNPPPPGYATPCPGTDGTSP